jgi:hypothetical protein
LFNIEIEFKPGIGKVKLGQESPPNFASPGTNWLGRKEHGAGTFCTAGSGRKATNRPPKAQQGAQAGKPGRLASTAKREAR